MSQKSNKTEENPIISALNAIIFSSKSHFEPMGALRDDEGLYWCAESKAYGDEIMGKPGKKDVDEAIRLMKLIQFKYPGLAVSWRAINEFVQVIVR